MPVAAWATASAISSWSVTSPGGPGRRIESDVANTYAAITRVSSEAHISCSNHEVAGLEALFLCRLALPAASANPHHASSQDSTRPEAPATVTRPRPALAIASYASPVAVAYTRWWKASIAISSFGQNTTGGAISSAGSVTWAEP